MINMIIIVIVYMVFIVIMVSMTVLVSNDYYVIIMSIIVSVVHRLHMNEFYVQDFGLLL